MRLIDADKLVEICRKGWRLFGYHDEKLKHWVDEYDINSQPTVEAIPVKWLKRWFERQVWQGSSPTDRIHCKASDIIEDWEKENALDKQIEKWESDDDMDWQTIQREQGNEKEDRT